MKKINLLALLTIIVFSSNHLFATDRVVQQGGPVGTYASITAAITAAVDGDNIVVNNRTDGLPWLETITINKSLTFVSAVDNIQWWMEGSVTINMAEGRVITIVGMRNTSGSFSKTGTTPVNRTVVNILYSDINGSINLPNGINLYLGSSKTNDLTYSYGKIYGNDLKSISLVADGVTTEDVNQIIGNRIGIHTVASTAVSLNSNTQYIYYSNNYARGVSTYGCYISSLKSGVNINRIINSTFSSNSTSSANSYAALDIQHSSGTLTVENCVLAGYYNTSTTGAMGVRIGGTASSLTTCTYNMYYNPHQASGYGTVLSTSLNNFSNSSAQLSYIGSDGAVTNGTAFVDAGNPSNFNLDLDLTRNDIGVYGGSYSMANFLPLMNNVESSRVNYMNTPRVVNQGGTVSVQVIGYDK